MKVYRFNNAVYKNDISGTGAFLNGGRWNEQEFYMLYTSEQISLALLDLLVHLKNEATLMQFNLLTIELPDNEQCYQQIFFKDLPKNWDADFSITKFIGTNFLKNNALLYLKVPSIVVPQENNVVINPKHKLFSKVKVVHSVLYKLDKRLA